MLRQIFALNFIFGIMTLPLQGATLEEQEKIIAVQQTQIKKLENDLTTLKNSLANYLTKNDAASTYLTPSTANSTYLTPAAGDTRYTTDAKVIDRLKKCYITLGFSKAAGTKPSPAAVSNDGNGFGSSVLSFPSTPVAGDKLYYDLNCMPLILVIPPGGWDFDPGLIKLNK